MQITLQTEEIESILLEAIAKRFSLPLDYEPTNYFSANANHECDAGDEVAIRNLTFTVALNDDPENLLRTPEVE